jgi:hypothetical protein
MHCVAQEAKTLARNHKIGFSILFISVRSFVGARQVLWLRIVGGLGVLSIGAARSTFCDFPGKNIVVCRASAFAC